MITFSSGTCLVLRIPGKYVIHIEACFHFKKNYTTFHLWTNFHPETNLMLSYLSKLIKTGVWSKTPLTRIIIPLLILNFHVFRKYYKYFKVFAIENSFFVSHSSEVFILLYSFIALFISIFSKVLGIYFGNFYVHRRYLQRLKERFLHL